jgi:hypothetical protein
MKITRRELRDFALLTALLTGLFTIGAHATVHHARPADLCSMAKFAQ